MARPAPDPAYVELTGQKVRPSRAKKEQEPAGVAPCARPKMPAYFSDVAAGEWKRLVKLLYKSGVVTKLDGSLLEVHCLNYEQLRRCEEEIKKYGAFETTAEGCRVESGPSKLLNKLSAQLRLSLQQLGATPASREKAKRASPSVKSAPPAPGSLADLLRRAAEAVDDEEPVVEPAPEIEEPVNDEI